MQFIRNQWFLKHDLLKLHYSELPTTIIRIAKRNIKREKTTQTYLTVWIERAHEMQQKMIMARQLYNITVLFARKFQYMYMDARGLKPNLQINRWPLNLL